MHLIESMDFVCRTLSVRLPKLKILRRRTWSESDSSGFQARLGGARLLVEIKILAQMRIQDLIGQLAAGAVQAGHKVGKRGPTPMVVVLAPTLGRKAMQAAERFMGHYLPQNGWAVLDRHGRARICIPSLNIDTDLPRTPHAPETKSAPERRLFTDLNQWLMKILLLPGIDRRLWSGPKEQIGSAADLQRAASVSLDKVYKFLRLMERKDFLRKTPAGFKLVRRQELIELWFAQEKLRPANKLPARNLYGSKPDLRHLAAPNSDREAGVLGGFAACKALGVLHTSVEAIDIHIAMPENAYLERFELEHCDERDAQFHLCRTKNPESVFRASASKGKIQVVDVFQAALDVVGHSARGLEQAEHIVELILKADNR